MTANGIELFQYTAGPSGEIGASEIFKYFLPATANPIWQTDGYPFVISSEAVTAIVGVIGGPGTLEFVIAQTDNNGGGHVRSTLLTSNPPNSGWTIFRMVMGPESGRLLCRWPAPRWSWPVVRLDRRRHHDLLGGISWSFLGNQQLGGFSISRVTLTFALRFISGCAA